MHCVEHEQQKNAGTDACQKLSSSVFLGNRFFCVEEAVLCILPCQSMEEQARNLFDEQYRIEKYKFDRRDHVIVHLCGTFNNNKVLTQRP